MSPVLAPSATTLRRPLERERRFTALYRSLLKAAPAEREARCWQILLPDLLAPLRPGDLLAGRLNRPLAGFGLEGHEFCCYGQVEAMRQALDDSEATADERAEAEAMIAFWEEHDSVRRCVAAYSPEARRIHERRSRNEPQIAMCWPRLSGTYLDYDRLVRLGLPGLRERVEARRSHALNAGEDGAVLDGWLAILDAIVTACRRYAAEARARSARPDDDAAHLAGTLDALTTRAPATLHEARQLCWIYAAPCGTRNLGRMDVVFGDLLASDLATGRLDEAGALRLTVALWKMIADHWDTSNSRVWIGGVGRRNPIHADRFAHLAMEATRAVHAELPQLTLRLHPDQDPALLDHALDVLADGNTFPILYNDAVNIPGVATAMRVSDEEAVGYMPLGCGEIVLDHRSLGSPNSAVNLAKALDVTLHDGIDPFTGRPEGIANPQHGRFATFEDLFAAYTAQVDHHMAIVAPMPAREYAVMREQRAFLFESLLYDDCLEKARGLIDGVSYRGGTTEIFGFVNVGDALAAIRTLVYERQALTLERLMAAINADWRGYAAERAMVQALPKYGEDDAATDALVRRVLTHICDTCRNRAAAVGLHSYLMVAINNHHHWVFGRLTAATADGRASGEPLANANNPTAGNGRRGPTAFLRSLASMPTDRHAGLVQNVRFSRDLLRRQRPRAKALLNGYFALGGSQAMVSVSDPGELEDAMAHPERHCDLLVRLGGFSAHFIDLEPSLQRDLINRVRLE